MADVKISELAEATNLSESDVLAGVNAATTRKFSLARLKAFFFAALTKADVGLGNVANVLQYSADNKPTPAELGAVPETRTVNGHPLSENVTVTKSDVGLNNVDNTSDANKPVSTAQQAAIDAAVQEAEAAIPAPSAADPQMDGTASPGSSGAWSRGDHVHPSDTSRVPTTRTVNGKALSADLVLDAVGSVALSLSWSGSEPYTQTVEVTGATVTANSKIDLQPTPAQIERLISEGVEALVIENNNGTLTATAIGAAPSTAMTVQCTVTEVTG